MVGWLVLRQINLGLFHTEYVFRLVGSLKKGARICYRSSVWLKFIDAAYLYDNDLYWDKRNGSHLEHVLLKCSLSARDIKLMLFNCYYISFQDM